jgi:hypothetical protein
VHWARHNQRLNSVRIEREQVCFCRRAAVVQRAANFLCGRYKMMHQKLIFKIQKNQLLSFLLLCFIDFNKFISRSKFPHSHTFNIFQSHTAELYFDPVSNSNSVISLSPFDFTRSFILLSAQCNQCSNPPNFRYSIFTRFLIAISHIRMSLQGTLAFQKT